MWCSRLICSAVKIVIGGHPTVLQWSQWISAPWRADLASRQVDFELAYSSSQVENLGKISEIMKNFPKYYWLWIFIIWLMQVWQVDSHLGKLNLGLLIRRSGRTSLGKFLTYTLQQGLTICPHIWATSMYKSIRGLYVKFCSWMGGCLYKSVSTCDNLTGNILWTTDSEAAS